MMDHHWKRGVLLGKGASGTVSVARMASPRKPSLIAVKSSPLSKSHSLVVEKVFLQHFEPCPYIIRCFGDDLTFENDENIYNILLEYAAGGSLADRIKIAGNSLPEDEVRRHTKAILRGLSYVHKQGYVHCDIKPQNVLLVKRNKGLVAKIADFGLIRKAGKGKERMEGGIDVSGLRGTAMYMAPESVNGNEYSQGVDIWGLGCSVLEMLTGKFPWWFDPCMGNVPILFKLGCTEQLPEIPSGLSPFAGDFLRRCLVRDTKLRWTADKLLNHPFITGEINEEEAIKPILIMSDTLLCGGRRLQSDQEAWRKRRRAEDDEEDMKLEKLGRYWGIKKSSLGVVASSCTPIQIFN